VLKPDMNECSKKSGDFGVAAIPRASNLSISRTFRAGKRGGHGRYENGKMSRNEYRKFKIRSVEGANDCLDARSGAATVSPGPRRRKAYLI